MYICVCIYTYQFSSVALSGPSLCGTMNHSTPGLPVHHTPGVHPNLMSTESVMLSNHLIHCHPLVLLPSIFPSTRVFSSESHILLHIVFHYGLSQDIEYSSLGSTVGPFCLSILYEIVFFFSLIIPNSQSFSSPPLSNHKHIVYLCESVFCR